MEKETVEIEKSELRAISDLGRAASRVIRALGAEDELERENEDRVKERDTQGTFSREIVDDFLLQVFKEKFERLAPICEDRVASDDGALCACRDSSPTDCCFGVCPKMDISPDEAAEILKGKER